MKQLLHKLREEISLEHTIQFRIDGQFYELLEGKNNWEPFTVFGTDLKFAKDYFKGLDRDQAIEALLKKYPKATIY